MAKHKYHTEYPVILKKKAKKAGVKLEKNIYRFVDKFMFIQAEDEHFAFDIDYDVEADEVRIIYTNAQGAEIQMTMDALLPYEVDFKARVACIRKGDIDWVSERILNGSLIDNHLSLKITLYKNDSYADIMMEGKCMIPSDVKEAAGRCALYFLVFLSQMNEIKHVVVHSEFGIRLKDCGDKKVKVIKIIRDHTNLGLKAVKELVDSAPDAIIHNISLADAYYLYNELAKVGADVEFV